MGFWTLLEVASMPVVQVLMISLLGALLATDYCKILSKDARSSLNKLVFVVFTPCLMFANLAKTVTLQDIISWWFMPVNIGITFLLGIIVGWVLVKVLRAKPHLEGLIIATCASGNLGNLPLIIVPAICDDESSPFGDHNICRSVGLSYASFSMALGGFYIWTVTYHLVRTSATKFKALDAAEATAVVKQPNKDIEAAAETPLLEAHESKPRLVKSLDHTDDSAVTTIVSQVPLDVTEKGKSSIWEKVIEFLHHILEELMAPPTLGAIVGFIFGAVKWLRELVVGDSAPLRVVQDSVKLLGDGTIPCITLILGGNLFQGLRSSTVRPVIIVGVVCVRYIVLPLIGVWIVKGAGILGFLPADPLYRFVLMIQYTLPPAMSISTMTQLFGVAQDECSVLFLWTYLVAALALTAWSTIFLWVLT